MAVNKDPCVNCPQEPTCDYPCKEAIDWTYLMERMKKKERKNGSKN